MFETSILGIEETLFEYYSAEDIKQAILESMGWTGFSELDTEIGFYKKKGKNSREKSQK